MDTSAEICLRKIGRVINDCAARPADLAARYGGEEFACILPETDINGAAVLQHIMRMNRASTVL